MSPARSFIAAAALCAVAAPALADDNALVADLYPLRRVGEPQDVAPAVVFLASGAASFITGQTLSTSGGYSMM